jgi:hypothetical protein
VGAKLMGCSTGSNSAVIYKIHELQSLNIVEYFLATMRFGKFGFSLCKAFPSPYAVSVLFFIHLSAQPPDYAKAVGDRLLYRAKAIGQNPLREKAINALSASEGRLASRTGRSLLASVVAAGWSAAHLGSARRF